jgi:hypothetical protein
MAESGAPTNDPTGTWWGEYELTSGETAEWNIENLQVVAKHDEYELLIAHRQIEAAEEQPEWQFAYSDLAIEEDVFEQIARFVFQEAPQKVTVLPALADRPVVSRPFVPLIVPAGENATIYVGTPLWFTLTAGPSANTLFEIPIQRPSDTWFGPSTMDGETCYASHTFARLNVENIPVEAEWAITRIHIRNDSDAALQIERLNLPVPYLSLFSTQYGRLITENVTMVQTREGAKAEFSLEKDLSTLPPGVVLVTSPRKIAQKGMLISAFSTLKLPGLG